MTKPAVLALSLFALPVALPTPLVAQQQPGKPIAGAPMTAEAPTADTPAGARWQRFLAEHQDGRWWSRWSPATGTPKAILGSGLPLAGWREDTLAEAREHGARVLQQHQELLGLGVSEFRPAIGARMGETWALVYEQWFRGLPVIGGRADVRIHRSGRVPMFGATAWPIDAAFDPTPRIDELDATRIAWQQVGFDLAKAPQPQTGRQPRLCLWGDLLSPVPTTVHLAWEIPTSNIDAQGRGPAGRYYIDARDGTVLHHTDDKLEGTAPGGGDERTGPTPPPLPIPCTGSVQYWIRTGIGGNSPLALQPAAGLAINVSGLGTVFADANGDYSFTLPPGVPVGIVTYTTGGVHSGLVTGSNSPAFNGVIVPGANPTVTMLTSAATDVQVAHTSTQYWIHRSNEFARSVLGNTPELDTADLIRPYVNEANTCNAYYLGNTLHFYAAGGGCNNSAFSTTIAHEWGHGLDDRYGGTSNAGFDGLSEAWGDIFAMYLTDQPVLLDHLYVDGSGTRNGVNNATYPSTFSEVHYAGQIFMGFAWILRQRLETTLGSRSAAIALTNHIVLGSIVADATDQPGAVTEVFLADDNDGNLANATPHATELMWACQQKNLPDPLGPQPANDGCAGAIEVVNGLNGPFSTNLALNSAPAFACSVAGSKDVWFRYLADVGPLTVSTCGRAGFDTLLEVLGGTCQNPTSLGCNDDACSLQSSLTVNIPAPGWYLIRVGGYLNQSGAFQLDVNGQPGNLASITRYGAACSLQSRSFYELFATAAAFDLANSAMTLVLQGDHYTAQAVGSFAAPPFRTPVLALGDDAAVTVTLPAPFAFPGGSTTSLEVCSNGFVSPATGNGIGYAPNAGAWLASPSPRWGTWHDFNPAAVGGGGVKYHTANNVAYVTWDGVFGFQGQSPSTWQLQFHLATGDVTFAWQTLSTAGAALLVGYAGGGASVDAGNRDLSTSLPATFATTALDCEPLDVSALAPHIAQTTTVYTQQFPVQSQLGAMLLSPTAPGRPISLAAIGMPGCFQHVGLPAVTEILVPGTAHICARNLTVPNMPGLMGLRLYLQSFAFAPGVNAQGIIASNGLDMTIGF